MLTLYHGRLAQTELPRPANESRFMIKRSRSVAAHNPTARHRGHSGRVSAASDSREITSPGTSA
jgi:hypothetical protein